AARRAAGTRSCGRAAACNGFRLPSIEAAPGGSAFADERRGLEARTVLCVQLLQPAEHLLHADRICPSQQAAAERREYGTGDHAEIDVTGGLHDAVLQDARGLVHHREQFTIENVLRGQFLPLRRQCRTETGVDLAVHFLLAAVLVRVEAAAALAAEQLRLRERA